METRKRSDKIKTRERLGKDKMMTRERLDKDKRMTRERQVSKIIVPILTLNNLPVCQAVTI